MKEPKLYGPWPKPGGREQSRVQWYEGRVRKSKAFANHGRAELFYRSKFSAMPSNEAQALLFEQVSIIKKAVSEFVRKESDLEKENLRLRRELSATEQHSPAAGGLTGGSLSGRVLITRPGLVLRIQKQFGLTGQTAKNVASLIQQLHYLIHERALGRIHKDGRRYVWFTYEEWKETQFPHWSKPTIKRTFAKAENLGLVLSRQPEGRVSRRKHYSLTPEGINLIPSGDDKCPNRSDQTDQNDPDRKGANSALPLPEIRSSAERHIPAGLSDEEWLEKVVQAKYPSWSLKQLRTQWREHGKKGKRTERWIPGNRGHFLDCWMPKAEQPRPPARKITEPAYWTDFISHRHPDARVRDFATIQTSYPGLVDEAAEWAKANGRQDVWAS